MVVRDGTLLATFNTIHTSYTTAVIDAMLLAIDTCSLAIAGTEAATVALGGVDNGLQPCEA